MTMRIHIAACFALCALSLNAAEKMPGVEKVDESFEFHIDPKCHADDSLELVVDLGEQRFSSNNAKEFQNKTVRLSFGSVRLTAQTDAKAVADKDNIQVKLIADGRGLKFSAAKKSFASLLDDFARQACGDEPKVELKVSAEVPGGKEDRVLYQSWLKLTIFSDTLLPEAREAVKQRAGSAPPKLVDDE